MPANAASTSSGMRPARRSAAKRARAAIDESALRSAAGGSGLSERRASSRWPSARRTSERAPLLATSNETTAPPSAASRPSTSASSQPNEARRARKRNAQPESGAAARGTRTLRRRGISVPPRRRCPRRARRARASWSSESPAIHCSPAPDDRAREVLLVLDHPVDPLLERPAADELVDLHVLRLADPEGAVRRLLLDGRVPPAVDVEDVRGAREVEARPARAEREHEERRRVVVLLEAPDHLGARAARDAAVQEQDLAAEALLERRDEEVAHLGELREEERRALLRERLLAHLEEARDLRAAPVQPPVAEEERRVVADLLEAQEEEQDLRLARPPVRARRSPRGASASSRGRARPARA